MILVLVFLFPQWGPGGSLSAHPMPNSMVVLNIHEKHISGEVLLPLSELQSAVGMSVNDHSERLVERLGGALREYLMKHIRPKSFEGVVWKVTVGEMQLLESNNPIVGTYKELAVEFEMTPPSGYDLRNFFFDYDVILHQVASHKALIHVKQDWAQGLVREDTLTQQIGVIEWDAVNNKLNPFLVSLQQGSRWKGFINMVHLGIDHIAEGTDHLLFVLTLLFPAMLVASDGRWRKRLALKASLLNLLKIITAFTVGHSLTLLIGALQWLHFPAKPIEVLITITILVAAFHALKPIYPKREVLIAGLFGLVHGLAFAETLTNLELSTTQMVLSILGFNVGIELMQLALIAVAFPLLFLLAKTSFYGPIRTVGAVMMMILAFAWMVERVQESPNFVTEWLASW
ncbi:HupE/UreJ family protein [Runella sp. SP2]|uniref:HupE/UreJ family protein n=1 Tax=Runella sp. SP2 TaxID=2268026 RepID=UPI000F078990|nr:HupE/UreJ family protein [Runella sp. SP2]AYQ32546.1 HupE/UreJ family protein [Runella sp. SP2]